MDGPYFQKQSWPPFVYQGVTYSLAHLDESHLEIEDSSKTLRRIALTFSDHCFTREPEPNEDAGLVYASSSRNPGCFCITRYHHSLQLIAHLTQAMTRTVWHLGHDGYAIVPTVDHQGRRTLYGIIFSLDPVTGLPVDLHLRVKSAHPRDEHDIITYGTIRFAHLMTLRMQRKHPKRITDRNRKRPRMG